jgi:hypothetical protein
MVEELVPTISLIFIRLQTCDKKLFTNIIKDPLLTWKAQYGLSPCEDSCFCKKKNIFSILKAADTNMLVRGGQLYCALPFSRTS